MARYVQGSDALKRKLAALPAAVAAALNPALKRSAEEVAADARALAEASRRTGSLADSIDATGPGGNHARLRCQWRQAHRRRRASICHRWQP